MLWTEEQYFLLFMENNNHLSQGTRGDSTSRNRRLNQNVVNLDSFSFKDTLFHRKINMNEVSRKFKPLLSQTQGMNKFNRYNFCVDKELKRYIKQLKTCPIEKPVHSPYIFKPLTERQSSDKKFETCKQKKERILGHIKTKAEEISRKEYMRCITEGEEILDHKVIELYNMAQKKALSQEKVNQLVGYVSHKEELKEKVVNIRRKPNKETSKLDSQKSNFVNDSIEQAKIRIRAQCRYLIEPTSRVFGAKLNCRRQKASAPDQFLRSLKKEVSSSSLKRVSKALAKNVLQQCKKGKFNSEI